MGEMSEALNQETAPIRERRLGSIRAWGGTANDLLAQAKAGKLEIKDRSYSNGWLCSYVLSAGLNIMFIKDACFICHTPIGCTCHLLQFYALAPPKTEMKELPGYKPFFPAPWYGTNLTEEDVIFGGEDKLRKTILTVEKEHHPKCIFITKSCSAGIIGDDIESIVRSVQPEVNAILVPIHNEPLRSRVTQWGWDAFGHAVLRYLVKKPEKKDENLINFVSGGGGMGRVGDLAYLKSMVGKVGLKVNSIVRFAEVEQFRDLANASASVAVCPTAGDYIVRGLEDLYGIPFINEPTPIGTSQTAEWLRKIAKMTHREAAMEKVIKDELEAVTPEIKELKKQLQGKRFFVAAGMARALYLPRMLIEDYGMEMVGTNPFEFGDNEIEPLENLVKFVGHGNFLVHIGDCQEFEVANYLHKLKPDIYITHRGLAACEYKSGIPTLYHMSPRQNPKDIEAGLCLGFKGVIPYAKYLIAILRNPSYGKKLAEHFKPPFKESWYNRDPFSKIVKPLR